MVNSLFFFFYLHLSNISYLLVNVYGLDLFLKVDATNI